MKCLTHLTPLITSQTPQTRLPQTTEKPVSRSSVDGEALAMEGDVFNGEAGRSRSRTLFWDLSQAEDRGSGQSRCSSASSGPFEFV